MYKHIYYSSIIIQILSFFITPPVQKIVLGYDIVESAIRLRFGKHRDAIIASIFSYFVIKFRFID